MKLNTFKRKKLSSFLSSEGIITALAFLLKFFRVCKEAFGKLHILLHRDQSTRGKYMPRGPINHYKKTHLKNKEWPVYKPSKEICLPKRMGLYPENQIIR